MPFDGSQWGGVFDDAHRDAGRNPYVGKAPGPIGVAHRFDTVYVTELYHRLNRPHSNAILRPSEGMNGSWSFRSSVKTST